MITPQVTIELGSTFARARDREKVRGGGGGGNGVAMVFFFYDRRKQCGVVPLLC